MNFNHKMDHFLSGLDSQAAPWYSHKAFQPHEFSVGLNSFQLIPVSGSAVPHCSTEREVVSVGTSGMLPHSALIAANSPLIAEVKQEIEMAEERMEHLGQPISHPPPKAPGKKSKNNPHVDTRKACNICGKILSRGDKLKNHIRIHTNNFPYHCDTCGHGFLRAEGLRVHTRIHTGERPYVCLVCGKTYTRKDKLTRHAIVHTGERPFSCQHCGKSFTRKDKMQRHELIHKVEKPWTCVPCNLEFVRQEGFNAHMERKHPERLPYTLIPPQQQRLLQKTLAGEFKDYNLADRSKDSNLSDRPTLVPPPPSVVMSSSTSGYILDHMMKNSLASTPIVMPTSISSGGPSGHAFDHMTKGSFPPPSVVMAPSTSGGHPLEHMTKSSFPPPSAVMTTPSTTGHALDHMTKGSFPPPSVVMAPTTSGHPLHHMAKASSQSSMSKSLPHVPTGSSTPSLTSEGPP